MTETFDFDKDGAAPIVYVRPVDVRELPADVQQKLPDEAELFAVHSETGERLALVTDRDAAFILARQNDLSPVSVH